MTAPTMYTIGYQGASLDVLVGALTKVGVSCLVDTRETPMSRRVEFRPNVLRSALADVGIEYRSVRELGAPKALRVLAEDDWDGFAAGYAARLRLAREQLEDLIPVIESERVCLLCFEADAGACHRSLLAQEIQGLLDVSTVHLLPGRADEPDDLKHVRVGGDVADDQVQIRRGWFSRSQALGAVKS